MSDAKEYKVTTLRDIYEKVPADRISDCCRELGRLLAQTKLMQDMMNSATQALGVDAQGITFNIPDEMTWIDDGKGVIQSNFILGDEKIATLETRPE